MIHEHKRNTKGIRPARMVEWKGETRKLVELAKEYDINVRTVVTRMDKQGWDLQKALETAPKYSPTTTEITDKKQYNTKTLILNKLMDTFFAKPKQFEKWVQAEMKADYGKFYKGVIMPFLPKPSQDRVVDKTQPASVVIEFNGVAPPEPLTFEANSDAKLLD